jgi:hypothetical protein
MAIGYSIHKPTDFIYWIALEEGELKLYGGVGPNQVCDIKYTDVQEYTNEQEWIDALVALGVDVEQIMKK